MIPRRENRNRIAMIAGNGAVAKAVVSRTILDALIRTKLANTAGCEGIEALPVVHSEQGPQGSNWIVPGWVGDSVAVEDCRRKVSHYIDFLAAQFNIPAELKTSRDRNEEA